jgi:hypothetical protein
VRNLPAIPGNISRSLPVFTLLSGISPQEKSECFQLTRIVGVLVPTVIRVYSPGVSSSTCEAGSPNQVAHVASPPGVFAPSRQRGLLGISVSKGCLYARSSESSLTKQRSSG